MWTELSNADFIGKFLFSPNILLMFLSYIKISWEDEEEVFIEPAERLKHKSDKQNNLDKLVN